MLWDRGGHVTLHCRRINAMFSIVFRMSRNKITRPTLHHVYDSCHLGLVHEIVNLCNLTNTTNPALEHLWKGVNGAADRLSFYWHLSRIGHCNGKYHYTDNDYKMNYVKKVACGLAVWDKVDRYWERWDVMISSRLIGDLIGCQAAGIQVDRCGMIADMQ